MIRQQLEITRSILSFADPTHKITFAAILNLSFVHRYEFKIKSETRLFGDKFSPRPQVRLSETFSWSR